MKSIVNFLAFSESNSFDRQLLSWHQSIKKSLQTQLRLLD